MFFINTISGLVKGRSQQKKRVFVKVRKTISPSVLNNVVCGDFCRCWSVMECLWGLHRGEKVLKMQT